MVTFTAKPHAHAAVAPDPFTASVTATARATNVTIAVTAGSPMRRGAGISGLQRRTEASTHAQRAGAELHARRAAELGALLDDVRGRIEAFARAHRAAIDQDPAFRSAFNTMCANAGVDPLQSSAGPWASILGVGDLYFELAVQVVDACLGARARAGGLVAVDSLLRAVRARRGTGARAVGRDDLLTAIAQLRRLGGGYGLVELGGETYVRALPRELDADQNAVLAAAAATARVTRRALVGGARGWSAARADEAIGALLAEGVLWVDAPDGGEEFWAPCLWERARGARAAAGEAT